MTTSVVDSGFSATGQLVTLVYKGKINDLTLTPTDSVTIVAPRGEHELHYTAPEHGEWGIR